MSISLNNHESRIAALETNKGSSSWTKGSNSNGYWAKDSGSGLIIQWGTCGINTDQWKTFDLPIPFTSGNFGFNVIGTSGRDNEWANGFDCTGRNTTQFSLGGRCAGGTKIWIAIGILYTYRYIIKSAQKFAPLSYLFNKEV